MVTNYFKYLALIAALLSQVQAACKHPPPAANYTNAAYSGVWYEMGKIQTEGGAFFQKDCHCTTVTISSEYPIWGDATTRNECRKYSADNLNSTVLEGTLTAGEVPGNFEQRFFENTPPTDYNVIWLDEDSAMEYDCSQALLNVEYCVHFMSRTDKIDPAKLEVMMNYAESLGLNPRNIQFETVDQVGCW